MIFDVEKEVPLFQSGLILLALLALLQAVVIWHLEPMLSRDGTFCAGQVTRKVQDGFSFYHTKTER